MEGIKYINLIEIGPAFIEIRGAENGELAVPVNTHLCVTRLSWTLTHDRVLIYICMYVCMYVCIQ